MKNPASGFGSGKHEAYVATTVAAPTAQDSAASGMVAADSCSTARSNVQRIAELETEALLRRSRVDRLWDAFVTMAGGSWFALCHVAWFGGWIAVNRGLVPGIEPFDPYPFNLLTMVVSLEAIFVTIGVLNSQNRMTRQADRRAHLDLQINLLAEGESTATLRLLRHIAQHLNIPIEDSDRQDGDLATDTDIGNVVRELDRQLPE
jgi:uncharacterized membrane protein